MTPMPADPLPQSARAMAIAKALRRSARRLRRAAPGTRGNIVLPQRRWDGVFQRAVRISFLVLFVCPVALAILYYGFIAAPRYVSTTQFTVRSEQGSDPAAGLAALAAQAPAQNTNIVANYIGSADMIAVLSRTLDLRAIYASPKADFFSRMRPDAPQEAFNRYWNRHVDVKVENMSNIVTVTVDAFTPHDAQAVANGVLKASETLVNQMSARARTDALRNAMATLAGLEADLADKTRAVRLLRERSGIMDPNATSAVATKTLGDLRGTLANLQIEYSSQLRWVRPDAPQMRVLSRLIADTGDQIRRMENQVTGSGASLAQSSAEFDKANLDLSVAQQQYLAAVVAVQRAREGLATQDIYVLPFEAPTLPQQALYPRRLAIVLAVMGVCLLLWGAVVGLGVLARNNMAG